ncbi:unnamed protein product [Pieris macdunnoughi]|nr:unnamed protein product [Pieris macdunnoughi]
MLESLDMRRDVQEIFRNTPHGKQVMMFSATLSKEIRPVCKKFMQDPMEVYVDDKAKLTLHGLQQHYVKLKENEKNKKLFELLDVLEFNQVVIFVKSVQRSIERLPEKDISDSDTYQHRVARAGRFGTKGLAITMVSDENDAKILNVVQDRFDVNITELPEEIELSTYIEGR